MLVIHKNPVFDGNFLPEPGQCQFHTGGWILRDHRRVQEEVLYEGSYYACRRIQQACCSKPQEEWKSIAAQLSSEIDALNMAETAIGIPAQPSPDETSDLEPLDDDTAETDAV